MFSGGGPAKRFLSVYILNFRCNEPLSARIDLHNDLSSADDNPDATFFVRKVLSTSGVQRCFDSNEVQIWLDQRREIVNIEVSGGKWLSEEEYESALADFQRRIGQDAAQNT